MSHASLALVEEPVTFVRDPRDPCWGLPAFPDFVTDFRDVQWDAFIRITQEFEAGADVVLLEAPVGTGKTIIAEMVRRWMNRRALYICSGKALQDQFARDFDYAKVLKGRSNYPTADHPERFEDPYDPVTAADCDKHRAFLPACSACPGDLEGHDHDNADDEVPHCSECHPVTACPHFRAKAVALGSSLACVNTALMLYEANLGEQLSGRGFVVVDECDMLEKELMSYVEVAISARRREQYKIPFPDRKTTEAGTKERLNTEGDVHTAWGDWFDTAMTILRRERSRLPDRPSDRKDRKEAKFLTRLIDDLERVRESIMDGTWVYTGHEKGEIIFKPVVVDAFGPQVLWRHAEKWLLMSGTIIDPQEMVTSLGLPEDKRWGLVTVPMTFPKENRPIKVVPTTEMNAKNKDEAWPKMAKKVAEIAAKHPDERILVHSVSYALTDFLASYLPRERVVTYKGAKEREDALARYKRQPAAILIGPSMDRGVDLPGDLCRVQVITKLPFPYLGDKQISTRLYGTRGGQTWYLVQCIRSFVQMTGRGVRNENDYAITYILDNAFMNNIWKKARNLIPSYMKEAIDWSGRL